MHLLDNFILFECTSDNGNGCSMSITHMLQMYIMWNQAVQARHRSRTLSTGVRACVCVCICVVDAPCIRCSLLYSSICPSFICDLVASNGPSFLIIHSMAEYCIWTGSEQTVVVHSYHQNVYNWLLCVCVCVSLWSSYMNRFLRHVITCLFLPFLLRLTFHNHIGWVWTSFEKSVRQDHSAAHWQHSFSLSLSLVM